MSQLFQPFNTNQVTCPSSPTPAIQIVPQNLDRNAILLVNHGTTNVFVGAQGIGTTNGVLLNGAAGATLSLPTTSALYCVAASGTQVISYIEVLL